MAVNRIVIKYNPLPPSLSSLFQGKNDTFKLSREKSSSEHHSFIFLAWGNALV
jgi:hypothetical protein